MPQPWLQQIKYEHGSGLAEDFRGAVTKLRATSLLYVLTSLFFMAAPDSSALVLLECLVAGTTHRPGLPQYEPQLQIGQRLMLAREADSTYDDWAVRVLTADADPVWLGYLPEGRNETVARLLDAGFPLEARLNHKAWEDEWLHLEIEVLLLPNKQ